MIVNFASKACQDIYDGTLSRYARKIPLGLHKKIRRLFDQIDAAQSIQDLKSPPGNHLEPLRGDLAGKWSIRVNDQWRIVFKWKNNEAIDVNVVDYH
jgi:proteic killer suppression protein